ncbi:MAG: hypothetical protein MI784_10945, partial [Cytophagales bacterium]|nr:hypothetical protein [Cytophagales bacterium]
APNIDFETRLIEFLNNPPFWPRMDSRLRQKKRRPFHPSKNDAYRHQNSKNCPNPLMFFP